jgi:hypothetical protein
MMIVPKTQGGTQVSINSVNVISTCTKIESDAVFADDRGGTLKSNRSAAMSTEAKTAILEHLGRQQQAMVSLVAELVNIDSGSYNKHGVDDLGDRLPTWLEAAGISCEILC